MIQDWWSVTCQLCCEHGSDASLVVAGDFNASLGSQNSRHVGALYAEMQDHAGDCVHVMLEQLVVGCRRRFLSTIAGNPRLMFIKEVMAPPVRTWWPCHGSGMMQRPCSSHFARWL